MQYSTVNIYRRIDRTNTSKILEAIHNLLLLILISLGGSGLLGFFDLPYNKDRSPLFFKFIYITLSGKNLPVKKNAIIWKKGEKYDTKKQ